MGEAEELKRMRSVLERELGPKGAAAVLFIGLDRNGSFPDSPREWSAFLQRGLRDALTERLDAAAADRIVGLLSTELQAETIAPPPGRHGKPSDVPTRELPKLVGPSKVLVVAKGSHLSRTLKGALGNRVVPMAVGEANRVSAFVKDFEPGVLVVDLTDPIDGLSAEIATGLAPDALVVIWGTGSAAKSLASGIVRKGIRATVLDRGEGVSPLVELVHGAAT